MAEHEHTCECLRCRLMRGYVEMCDVELDEANACVIVENEAYELALGA